MFVHGVGEQRRGYSSAARSRMGAALALRGIMMHSQEVVWAPVMDALEAKMMADVGKLGSRNNMVQRFDIGTAADANSYPNCREQIMDMMDGAFIRLRTDTVHLFCHSLGAMVACDWLRTRKTVRATMTSFGCNMQSFYLGADFDCPKPLRGLNRWRNLFYRDDGFGWPIAKWQSQVEDVEISKPLFRLSTLVPALSHLDYWADSRLWGSTIPGGF
jgi:hypothetical protein